MNQQQLWTKTHHHRDDPETSKLAAQSARAMADAHRALVLSIIRVAGCAVSAEEIAGRCRLDRLQVMKRISDLKDAKLIVVSPERWRNASGRFADMYLPKEKNDDAG